MTRPSGVHEVHADLGVAWTVPATRAWVVGALEAGRTLYEAAAAEDDITVLSGRGPVYAFAADGGRHVVRRNRRGGAMATLLGERFLRAGTPRPFREMASSDEARRRGIPTPPILAVALYPHGPFYRADVVSESVGDARDLASFLFGMAAPRRGEAATDAVAEPGLRHAAVRETAYLLSRMARAGVEHPDLNAKNVLVQHRGEALTAFLVDLDKVRVHAPGRALSPAAMRERLERSLRKFERAGGRSLSGQEWAGLREAPSANRAA